MPIGQRPYRSRAGGKTSKRRRRNHSPAFEAKVALAAVKGEKSLANDFLAGVLGKAGVLPNAKQ